MKNTQPQKCNAFPVHAHRKRSQPLQETIPFELVPDASTIEGKNEQCHYKVKEGSHYKLEEKSLFIPGLVQCLVRCPASWQWKHFPLSGQEATWWPSFLQMSHIIGWPSNWTFTQTPWAEMNQWMGFTRGIHVMRVGVHTSGMLVHFWNLTSFTLPKVLHSLISTSLLIS